MGDERPSLAIRRKSIVGAIAAAAVASPLGAGPATLLSPCTSHEASPRRKAAEQQDSLPGSVGNEETPTPPRRKAERADEEIPAPRDVAQWPEAVSVCLVPINSSTEKPPAHLVPVKRPASIAARLVPVTAEDA